MVRLGVKKIQKNMRIFSKTLLAMSQWLTHLVLAMLDALGTPRHGIGQGHWRAGGHLQPVALLSDHSVELERERG